MCPAGTTKIGAATLAGGIQEGVGTKDASRASTRWDEPMGVAGPAVTSKPYPLYTAEYASVRVRLVDLFIKDKVIRYATPDEDFIEIGVTLAELTVRGPYELHHSVEIYPSLQEFRITGPYSLQEEMSVSVGLIQIEHSVSSYIAEEMSISVELVEVTIA